jgi:hypothetical protein
MDTDGRADLGPESRELAPAFGLFGLAGGQDAEPVTHAGGPGTGDDLGKIRVKGGIGEMEV